MMLRIKTIIIILSVYLFTSCSNNKIEKYYYPTGELLTEVEVDNKGQNNGFLKEYYKTGKLKGLANYKSGIKIDSALIYYETGNIYTIENYTNGLSDSTRTIYESGELKIIMIRINKNEFFQKEYSKNNEIISSGNVKDSLKYSFWEFYNNDKRTKKVIEYLALNDKEYINQVISYNKNGNIIKDSSNYYTINFPDTLEIGKSTLGEIKLNPNLSKEHDFHKVYFWYEDLNGNIIFNDTTYGKNKKPAPIWYFPKISGKQNLKGYILEKGMKIEPNEKDTITVDINYLSTKMYFNKSIYVKDSLN
jgi:antitoxin component YwqK of YwqJK toxin-antitoxin module